MSEDHVLDGGNDRITPEQSAVVKLDPLERVIPHQNGWAVLSEDGAKTLTVLGAYHHALNRAKATAAG